MSTASYRSFSGAGAENYERFFVPAIARPVSAVLLAAADLRPGERVLDVACGTGLIARLAAEQVGPTGTVTGIDLAPDMVDVARATPASVGAAIEWHVGDANSLPFDDGTFDAVLCQMGLMFMADRAGALAEMGRVLAPDGRVVVSTPGAIQPPFVILEQAIVEHISADLGSFVRAVFSMDAPDAIATLMREAGLRDVTATVSPVNLQLPTPTEFLWQYINLTPMGPFVAQASEAAQSAMERQAVEAWQPHLESGTIKAEQPMVVAFGRS
jgi:ubiquinone/menaquinone biosynthesis C-methylase UbiE